jgi:SAP domain.
MGKEIPTADTFDIKKCKNYSVAGLKALAKKLGARCTGNNDELCKNIHEFLSLKNKGKKGGKVEDDGTENDGTEDDGTENDGTEDDEEKFDLKKCMQYKAPELKKFCNQYGLKISGTKQVLCDRLKEHFKEKSPPKKSPKKSPPKPKSPKKSSDEENFTDPEQCYNKHSQKKLQEECKKYGLKVSGNKTVLCERLKEHLKKNKSPSLQRSLHQRSPSHL